MTKAENDRASLATVTDRDKLDIGALVVNSWWQMQVQVGLHASSNRFISPLPLLLSSSLSDRRDSIEGDRVSSAASSNRGVFAAAFVSAQIGTSAGSSFTVGVAYAAGGKLAGNSFARVALPGCALASPGLGGSGFVGTPFAKGICPPAGTKIHVPAGCPAGGPSVA